MMTFDDMLQDDNENLFLGGNEFEKPIEWDGETEWTDPVTQEVKPIKAVVEDGGEEEGMAEGVFLDRKTVFISSRMITKPVPDSYHTLNGGSYYVQSVSDDNGMLEIHLYRGEA